MLKTAGFLFAPIPSSLGAAFFHGALGAPAERAGVRLSRRHSCVRKSAPAARKSATRSSAPSELKIGALLLPEGGSVFYGYYVSEFRSGASTFSRARKGGVKIGSGWRAHYGRAIEALLVHGTPEE